MRDICVCPTNSRSFRFYLPYNYLHEKNPINWLVLSNDIVGQRILQWDWIRGTPDHIQPKEVASDVAFPWRLI